MKLMTPLAAIVACASLAGCGEKPAKAPAPTRVAAAPFVPRCDIFTKDDQGVIEVQCTGKASVKFKIGDKDYAFTGGQCHQTQGNWAMIAGVSTGDIAPDPLPNGFSLTEFNWERGPFSNGVITIVVDGKRYNVRPNQGIFDAKGGTFEGETRFSHLKVSGTFDCG